ncbi:MAG TPA: response regulator [Patescibacteria group bacterium]|nr:response regulator [Patescibacteria group bacterium]
MARIVIVEDDSLVAMGMRIYLETRGHTILAVVSTGPQAVAAVLHDDPDLVLMDVRLKGDMDGIDAAQMILARRQVPIVFVSGSGEPQTLERIRAVRPAGLLLKPVTPSDLAAEVERAAAVV